MSDFVDHYGAIYEHSRWVAEQAEALLGESRATVLVAEVMKQCVDNASTGRQLALIRAHPDLAGRAQVAGELTDESSLEQASAGLHQCTTTEYERFQFLNGAYKEKFSFPFVMAVRDSSREEILAAFEQRLANDYDIEFDTALAEIHKIAQLRLVALEAG
jgi:OHCU decarboxylase